MNQEFVIDKVSVHPPEAWNSAYGPMLAYKVQIKGRELPVTINKKEASPAPKVGDQIYGRIQNDGHGDKFKSEKRPQTQGSSTGSGSSGYVPRDDEAIQAQWAIGHVLDNYGKGVKDFSDADYAAVEISSTMFFAMIDRVKGSKPLQTDQLPSGESVFPSDPPTDYTDDNSQVPF